MDAQTLLVDTHSHLPPAATLAGLSPEEATRRVNGVPHTIAEIVAHMGFWQEWFTRGVAGEAIGPVVSAADGWPDAPARRWPEVCDDFLSGLDRLAAVVRELEPDAAVAPAFPVEMLHGYTARDVWEHVAQHNAHHLGQVVILRQMLGLWPPPAGSFTW